MSKYGVISGPYFPVFGLNTGKYGPEITPYLDTFHAVMHSQNLVFRLFTGKDRPNHLTLLWKNNGRKKWDKAPHRIQRNITCKLCFYHGFLYLYISFRKQHWQDFTIKSSNVGKKIVICFLWKLSRWTQQFFKIKYSIKQHRLLPLKFKLKV